MLEQRRAYHVAAASDRAGRARAEGTSETRTLAAALPAGEQQGATPKRPRRPTLQTKRQAHRPAADPKPELTVAPPTARCLSSPSLVGAPPRRRRRGRVSCRRCLPTGLSGCWPTLGPVSARAPSPSWPALVCSRVRAQLRDLEAAGRVRRTGDRRSTRWLLIVDEDRIAERVAELERLVGARREDRTQRRGRARAS